ncbi:MAG TPA: cyclohexanecarboxylate-CoA ligase, partial [Gordonia sp. (in: high G+C Gram-positive bacteria)]|nr:cyclohexanecarboxylate-CoA ligase [Gordonia sp. (in: high G+C Gram-positive bacteria)]
MATRSVTDSVSGAPAPVSRRGVIGTDEIGGLWDLVEQSAQLRPELVILADDHGRSLTAAQFRDAAENAAAGLAERGVAAGDV